MTTTTPAQRFIASDELRSRINTLADQVADDMAHLAELAQKAEQSDSYYLYDTTCDDVWALHSNQLADLLEEITGKRIWPNTRPYWDVHETHPEE